MVAKKGVEALQAIILADSFTKELELGPITLECPKVLLPLVNTPMIDYTLAWLESAGVEQVFVLCRSHSKQIVNYLDKNSKWGVNKPNFSVTTIEAPNNCASAGDALHLIYQRNVIQGDFILVNGDTVTNIMLTQALEEHQERKGEDKDAVMTMLIRQKSAEAAAQTHIGTTDDEFIMGIDPSTKELIYYADKADNIKFDKQDVITSNPCFALYYDKQDCYIDICSPKILSLFTDKYDYQDLRRDFVKGLLFDGLMGCKIFTHQVDSSCYAARIDSFGSYDLISKDIIQRRFVPDHVQFSITKSEYACSSNITQSQVGPFTYIGNNTMISNSVVGDGCKIGCNVVIDGCYIWDNVRIEDGCKLRHAILCNGAVMKSGAVLERGVVLSYKVVVGQDIVVPSYSKVSLLPQPPDISDEEEVLEYKSGNDGVVSDDMGEDGRGFIWSMNNVEEWRHLVAPIPEEADVKSHHHRIFEESVETIFLRAVYADGKCTRRLQLLHLTFGMDPAECAAALLRSIMKLAVDTWKKNSSGNDLAKEITVMISKWGNLLKPFLLDDVDEKIEVISKLEEMCGGESLKEYYAPLFVHVLCILYDKDVIQRDAILKWANDKEHDADNVFVKQSEKFIQRLKEEKDQGHHIYLAN